MLPERNSGIIMKFWRVKLLWNRERHYVATPNMAVWKRLARLAPDAPDTLSFADVLERFFANF